MTIPSWCRVGQKVVCRDGGTFAQMGDEIVPQAGSIYTIRTVEVFDGRAFLRFMEIVNNPHDYKDGFGEVDFSADGFAPLISQQDDLAAHFNHHLTTRATERV